MSDFDIERLREAKPTQRIGFFCGLAILALLRGGKLRERKGGRGKDAGEERAEVIKARDSVSFARR